MVHRDRLGTDGKLNSTNAAFSHVQALLREGKVKDVPTIVGAARDELAGLDAGGLAAYANLSAEGFRRWLRDQYGVEHVETMLKLYPVSSARVGTEGTHMKTKLLLL